MNVQESKQEIFKKLNEKVKETIDFIGAIRGKNSVRERTLDKIEEELRRFLKFKGVEDLQHHLRAIESEPTSEGADTDYTYSEHSLVGEDYKTLFEYLEEIYELVYEYRGS